VSKNVVGNYNNVKILNDGDNPSDHLGISTTVNVITNNSHFVHPNKDIKKNVKLNWCNADVGCYTNTVCKLLAAIDIPTDTLLCRADCAVDHAARLDKYYSDINAVYWLFPESRCITTEKNW